MDNNTIETLSLSDAKAAHAGCHIEVIERSYGEDARPAIYVWGSEADAENDDGSKAVALYWMADRCEQ